MLFFILGSFLSSVVGQGSSPSVPGLPFFGPDSGGASRETVHGRPDNIVGPCLGLLVNAPYIFPNNAQEEQIYTGEERDYQDYRSKALRRVQPEFCVQRI